MNYSFYLITCLSVFSIQYTNRTNICNIMSRVTYTSDVIGGDTSSISDTITSNWLLLSLPLFKGTGIVEHNTPHSQVIDSAIACDVNHEQNDLIPIQVMGALPTEDDGTGVGDSSMRREDNAFMVGARKKQKINHINSKYMKTKRANKGEKCTNQRQDNCIGVARLFYLVDEIVESCNT